MKIVIEKGLNKYKSVLFILFMCYHQFIGILRTVVSTDLWADLAQTLIIMLLIFLFLKSSQKEKIICVSFIIILLIALFLFPQTPAIMGVNGITRSLQVTQGFIGFFIAFICADNYRLLKDLKIVGFILFVYYTWYVLTGRVYVTSDYNAAGYNMSFGFSAMAACLITLFFAFKEKKKIMKIVWMVMSVLLTLYIILLGSRGPLIGIVCITAISYLTVFLRDKNVKSLKKISSILLLSFVLLGLLIIPDVFIETISFFASKFGFDVEQSRTFQHIINGTLTVNSGRTAIWKWFSSNLNLLGHGAYSEWYYYYTYAHNFFLDILFDFGIIFGLLIIVFFIVMVIKSFYKGYMYESYSLFTICFSYFVGRLLLSSTFWWETYFWMLLGVMIRLIYQSKKSRYRRNSLILDSL